MALVRLAKPSDYVAVRVLRRTMYRCRAMKDYAQGVPPTRRRRGLRSSTNDK